MDLKKTYIPENPDFIDINLLVNNTFYEDDNLQLTLDIISSDEEQFKFCLSGETNEGSFRIDTRIAFERHKPGHGHELPHVQWNIQNTSSDTFKNGVLHVTLLIKDSENILECTKGFVKIIHEILEFIEKELEYEKGLITSHFFYDGVNDYESYKSMLHDKIFHSIDKDKYFLKKHNTKLVELKRKKSDDINLQTDIKKILLLIILTYENPIIRPLLETPTYNYLNSIPEIKNKNLTIDQLKEIVIKNYESGKKFEKVTTKSFLKLL